jgi:hypothetical protein
LWTRPLFGRGSARLSPTHLAAPSAARICNHNSISFQLITHFHLVPRSKLVELYLCYQMSSWNNLNELSKGNILTFWTVLIFENSGRSWCRIRKLYYQPTNPKVWVWRKIQQPITIGDWG